MARRQARTLLVTGKGGVGKSLIAHELAVEAAARGLRVSLVDAVAPEDRWDERVESDVPSVDRFTLDTGEALHHMLARVLRFGAFADFLMDSRTCSAVAAAAPGLADFVRIDYLRELAWGRVRGRRDLVIVNAPASGHCVAMLEAPLRIGELARRGPGSAAAREAREFVQDRRAFRVAVVATPEELPVLETAELHAELARLDVSATVTLVNGVYPPLTTEEQERWLATKEVSDDARLYLARRRRQLALTATIASPAGAPLVLPYVFETPSIPGADRARIFDVLCGAWT
jgi:anion-transporting  ArsA/GET3 family ATPase